MALTEAQIMAVPGGPGVTGAVKAGTGITISADGTISAAGGGGGVPSGSVLLFLQASAPAGWTKSTSYDDYAIRIVSGNGGGTGGSQGFSSVFAPYTPQGTVSSSGSCTPQGSISLGGLSVSGTVGGTSITKNQLANHAHALGNAYNFGSGSGGWAVGSASGGVAATPASGSITPAGFGDSHTHSFSGSVSGSGTFNGSSTTVSVNSSFTGSQTNQFQVRYVDAIVCTKD